MCDVRPAVMTTAMLRRSGLSRTQLREQLRAGILERRRRGVYVIADACDAARAVAGHGGRLACVTAAKHLGLWVLTADPRAHVWLCDGQRTYHANGCGCVEHWDDGPLGPPGSTPSIPRLLLQIARCHGVEEFFVVLESALRLGQLDDSGRRWLRQRSTAAMREALDLARDDADSGLESLLRWRLRHLGLRVRTQRRIAGVGVVDALIGDRLLVEADGVDNHDGAPHRHKDLVRDATAAIWGFMTLRFDYAMIVHDWDLVEAAIVGALATLGRAEQHHL
ncbi:MULTISPECIES: type IV toxin-antitoxin system AbiEi family antitoxin domain-containing protein [Microbacterium]|uniref:Uncharacterized protein n=1 Tax=Microbacterium hominis TaxID=162426 RepID=A0A2K9D5N2_9MICO|nr:MULTISPECIES: type IV toxin-antitoxin system AbiEi family antitoxin domain-containing protein [Microbacterium]AUG28970.1 hypothetical protein CXR34_05460 [Microbacterium hominis]